MNRPICTLKRGFRWLIIPSQVADKEDLTSLAIGQSGFFPAVYHPTSTYEHHSDCEYEIIPGASSNRWGATSFLSSMALVYIHVYKVVV